MCALPKYVGSLTVTVVVCVYSKNHRSEPEKQNRELHAVVLISPGYSDTLCVAVLRADGLLQLIQLPRLLQLLHQALHGFLAPFLLLTSSILLPDSTYSSSCSPATCRSLLPSQETFHYRGSEGKDGGHGG